MTHEIAMDPEVEVFRYLQPRKVLIADPSVATRTTVVEILKSLGVKWANIRQVADFPSAEKMEKEFLPEVLICDLKLPGGSGLHLLQPRPTHAPRLRIVVSRDGSRTSIVEAAEAGVDGYILKPFTAKSFRQHFCEAVLRHAKPDPYRDLIEQGLDAWATGEPEKAKQLLGRAATLSEHPVLALSYLGQILAELGDTSGALALFEAGLAASPHHFRCLLGLFDLHRSRGELSAAYAALNTLTEHYPLSACRLEQALDLALELGRFDLVPITYQSYLGLRHRTTELSAKMVEALLRGGSALLGAEGAAAGMVLLRQAIVSSGRSLAVLAGAVHALLERGYPRGAVELLGEAPPEQRLELEFRSLGYEVAAAIEAAPAVFEQGVRLLKDGVHHPAIYRILAARARALGKVDYADQLEHDAAKRWPGPAIG